jgi:hypothetical protein
MQNDASKPRPQNSAMMLSGRASVCAFSASLLRTLAIPVFTATSSSGLEIIQNRRDSFQDGFAVAENGFVGTVVPGLRRTKNERRSGSAGRSRLWRALPGRNRSAPDVHFKCTFRAAALAGIQQQSDEIGHRCRMGGFGSHRLNLRKPSAAAVGRWIAVDGSGSRGLIGSSPQ